MGFDSALLAPAGSTGNITGPAVALGSGWQAFALQFVVEAAGGSPTVTYKFQASLDGTNWFDVGYITDASDTIATATRVATSTGAQVAFVSNPVARQFLYFRVVTTGNNNITFRAEAYRID